MAKGRDLSRGRVGNRILSLYPARFYCRAGLSGIGSAGLTRICGVPQREPLPFDQQFRALVYHLPGRQAGNITAPPIAPPLLGLVERHISQFEAVAPE
jgi:hypothetical protein